MGRPVIDLRKVDENAQCIGSDVIYLVEVADKNTPGTTYTMNYDDGTEPGSVDKRSVEESESAVCTSV